MNFLFIEPIMEINLGLAYLSAVLLEHGHRVHVICGDRRIERINSKIEEFDPQVIGLSLLIAPKKVEDLARGIIKKKETLLICGGPQMSVEGRNFIEKNPCFDFGVVGEAEEAILEIVDFVDGNKELKEIKGIIGRDNGVLFETEQREFLGNLDNLPFPAYNVFDIFANGMSEYGMITSRGCPYRCTYCNGPLVSGRKWRYRSVESVVEEFARAKSLYDLKCVNILDDNFTFHLERAKDICRGIIDSGLDLKWRLPNGIRADKVDDELAGLMREAGCRVARVGIESGSPEVFESLKKGEKLEDVERGLRILNKNGIKTHGSFIIGLPGSNYEKDLQSIEFAKQLQISTAAFHIFCPLNKTEAHEMTYEQDGIRILQAGTEGTATYWGGRPPFDTEEYPEKDRIKAYMKGNLRFNDYAFTRRIAKSNFGMNRLVILAKAIVLYDPVYIPIHIFRLTKKLFLSVFEKLSRKNRNGVHAARNGGGEPLYAYVGNSIDVDKSISLSKNDSKQDHFMVTEAIGSLKDRGNTK